ncbi:hypothetical protein GBAR_LOCUS6328 [Geodia barretti]|uniref:Uncharacterized protein n=1 Tax=Geodia barretti TaxID=519541 RepID=A0AA35W601_GEOBA|nr:hypothetical protein GBAR_LOCUS6328 [Geodia barretti]
MPCPVHRSSSLLTWWSSLTWPATCSPGHALFSSSLHPFYFTPNAVHFAALDSLTDFTSKPDMNVMMKVVDLAGAPSEFTHYVYWKRQRMIKGWGMVREENPKLGAGRVVDQMAPWESFQVLGPHSGVNICDTNSIKRCCRLEGHSFAEFTNSSLDSVPASSTSSTVAILKPMTSCPTSPERFLICRGFTGCKTILIEMLLEVNSHMTELNSSVNSQLDVLEIVPMQQLLGALLV